jgi:integrase
MFFKARDTIIDRMKTTKAILSMSDLRAMYQSLINTHPRYGVLWLLGIESGLRIGDMLLLRVSDILPNTKYWLEVTESKTGKTRKIEMSSSLREDINELVTNYKLTPTDFLFFSTGKNKGKPISRQWAHRIIARNALNFALQDVGAHSMRRTYACTLYCVTGSLQRVQEAMGHKYASTTLIYLSDLLPRTLNP